MIEKEQVIERKNKLWYTHKIYTNLDSSFGICELKRDKKCIVLTDDEFYLDDENEFHQIVIERFANEGVVLGSKFYQKKMERVELLKTLDIEVVDFNNGDDLTLRRYGVNTIPYNASNFMLFAESDLISDVLRRFRELQLNGGNTALVEKWKDDKLRINREQMDIHQEREVQQQVKILTIDDKKKRIRDCLIEKGLV